MIDGGGWYHVKHTDDGSLGFQPADLLEGGEINNIGDHTWSIDYSNMEYD